MNVLIVAPKVVIPFYIRLSPWLFSISRRKKPLSAIIHDTCVSSKIGIKVLRFRITHAGVQAEPILA